MKSKTKWIAQTAMLTALLLVFQFSTKPLGQLVTGSFVNTVLAVSAITVGMSSGLTVAILSPFFAFFLGIGPQFFPLTPAIAAGNCILVILLCLMCNKSKSFIGNSICCAGAALGKFLVLNILILQLICRFLPLAEKQIATFSAMFSWPQLITALIGNFLGIIISAKLKGLINK